MAALEPRLRVTVLGATGYVGGELLRLLTGHPAVTEVTAISASRAGEPWSSVHPSLVNLSAEHRFAAFEPETVASGADVVMLALPHGESQRLLSTIEASGPGLVVDTAADFRLDDRKRAEAVYGPHAMPEALGSFACGLADVEGQALRGARRIAVPGCFATATLLALYPLAPFLHAATDAACWAATGSSGSGAAARPTTHHPHRAHNLYAYSLSGHRHEAELDERMQAWCGSNAPRCSLLTHSAPIVRGIHATLRVRFAKPVEDPLEVMRTAYRGRVFVHVLDRPPEVAAVVGTNHAHLSVAVRDGGREVVVLSVIDNLVKGAAGQAVQAMNLALGLPETSGLEFAGLAPC